MATRKSGVSEALGSASVSETDGDRTDQHLGRGVEEDAREDAERARGRAVRHADAEDEDARRVDERPAVPGRQGQPLGLRRKSNGGRDKRAHVDPEASQARERPLSVTRDREWVEAERAPGEDEAEDRAACRDRQRVEGRQLLRSSLA